MPSMKYWEIVADKLGPAIAVRSHCTAGAGLLTPHREGRRYIVHSDELLSALLESEATLRERRKPRSPIVLDHRYNFIHSNPEYARNR